MLQYMFAKSCIFSSILNIMLKIRRNLSGKLFVFPPVPQDVH